MSNQEISEEAQKALDKALKILSMAQRKQGNEAEAEVAAQKFQELLLKYNLDAAAIDQAQGAQSGKREEVKVAGGVYKFQKELWSWCATLNFCLYWNTQGWESREVKVKHWTGERRTVTRYKTVWRHRLVGRTHNVKAAIALAQYLEQAIEREVMESLGNENTMRFSRYAVSMREGMSDRLCEKIAKKRREFLADEERRRQETMEAARQAGREGVATSTAVTLANYEQAERDANVDHIMGEGWSARKAAERAAEAQAAAEAEAAYARWAAEHPEEARKQEQERREKERKAAGRSRGGSGPKEREKDWGAYYRGRDKAESIGIDTQVDRSARKQIGGGG